MAKPADVDMSPAAVAARLEEVRQLNRLVESLGRAKLVVPDPKRPTR